MGMCVSNLKLLNGIRVCVCGGADSHIQKYLNCFKNRNKNDKTRTKNKKKKTPELPIN